MFTHTNTLLTRLSIAALALAIPLSVASAKTPNVSGITASQQNGKVVVSWTPVEGASKYRIFYSHTSIMEQGGVYDDYEDAPGTTSTYTLTGVPPVSTLYVSVLAVGADGTESPFFLEEATVQLTPSGAQQQSAASSVATLPPSPTVAMDSSTLQLLTATSTSSTGVVLVFTHPLSIPQQYKDVAFVIKTGSGNALAVTRYRLEGNLAILDTAPQSAGTVYQVSVHGSVAGKMPQGDLVPQEQGMAPLLFTGQQVNLSVPDVLNLQLTRKGNAVEAVWTLPAATIRELQVQQSTNGGRTFGTAVRMDKASKGVTIPGVTAAQFTLLVRVVGADGTISKGAQQTITTGAQSSSSSKTTTSSSSKSSVSSKPATTPGSLPSSGLGLTTIIALSGAATGIRLFRQKNAPLS